MAELELSLAAFDVKVEHLNGMIEIVPKRLHKGVIVKQILRAVSVRFAAEVGRGRGRLACARRRVCVCSPARASARRPRFIVGSRGVSVAFSPEGRSCELLDNNYNNNNNNCDVVV